MFGFYKVTHFANSFLCGTASHIEVIRMLFFFFHLSLNIFFYEKEYTLPLGIRDSSSAPSCLHSAKEMP